MHNSIAVSIKDENFVRYLTKEEGHLILPEGFDLPTFSNKCESSDDEPWSDDEVFFYLFHNLKKIKFEYKLLVLEKYTQFEY